MAEIGLSAIVFTVELKSLLKKYKVSIKENDQYNGSEEYIGTESYFVFDGEPYYNKTIPEFINELSKQKT